MSVHPSKKSFFDFNEIWHVGRGRWVMHGGMQYDPIQGQGHKPLKVGNPSIFKSYFLRYLQWQLAADHGCLNKCAISKVDRAGFLIFVFVFCVTWLWTWQKRQLWRVDRQSHAGLIFITLLLFLLLLSCDMSHLSFTVKENVKQAYYFGRINHWILLFFHC